MPVVDASALVEYLAGGEHAEQVRARMLAGSQRLWAPHLVDAEVGHVLRRVVMLGELRSSVARDALEDLSAMPLKRVAHVGLLGRAWALRGNVSFYDGLYVALAERLQMPLLTLDARLEGAPGVRAVVDLVS